MMSQEEIQAAIDRLVDRGFVATVRNVRQELGDRGSFARIHEVVSAWRSKQVTTPRM
jgi:hypothetical protein